MIYAICFNKLISILFGRLAGKSIKTMRGKSVECNLQIILHKLIDTKQRKTMVR